jgi:hypothetical protein
VACAIGAAVAQGGKVRPELLEGITDSPEEAREMSYQINAERERRKFAKAGEQGPLGILRLGR